MLNKKQIPKELYAKDKREKSFMDYVIWIDFPINAGIFAYIVVGIVQAFQMGLNIAVEKGLPTTGNKAMDEMLNACLPLMTIYIVLAVAVEFIYLMLKLRKKQPFITEKYAIGILIGKIIWALFFIATALVF